MGTAAGHRGSNRVSDPADLGLLEAAVALHRGQFSALELTQACLRRIEERNGGPPSFEGSPSSVNAWARIYPEQAQADARASDDRLRREGASAPLLCGIPLAVKDLFGLAGLPLTASSRVLDGNVAERDAALVAVLRAQGMVVLGHTHTHEFAAGGTTDQVGNPWDTSVVAGGSSGGSAAALASFMAPAALGTDTCGSLRIPSACCGTSTIKPTHGRLSTEGIVPLAPSLDHPGPMARTVADAAALLSAMARAHEVTPLAPPPAPLGTLPLRPRRGVRPLRGALCALTDHGCSVPWDNEVGTAFEGARRACEVLGARIVELPAPWDFEPDDLTAVLMTEAWLFHEQFEERRALYRPAVAEFVEAARSYREARPYLIAQARRAAGTARWEQWFASNGVDFVLEPTLPVLPPRRGNGYESGRAAGVGDPLTALTALWNMTGLPVVSLPVTRHVGVSLIGPRGSEAVMVQVGTDLQERVLGVPS